MNNVKDKGINVVLNDLDLNFENQTFQVAIVTSISWKNANMTSWAS